MKTRFRLIVPAAASFALAAAALAGAARADDAPMKDNAMSGGHMMSGHKSMMKMHDKKQISKGGAMAGHMDHMAPATDQK
jgi:Spy/CpxP family protein refolding chaperone